MGVRNKIFRVMKRIRSNFIEITCSILVLCFLWIVMKQLLFTRTVTHAEVGKYHEKRSINSRNADYNWTWICSNSKCSKTRANESLELVCLETCTIMCMEDPIWPKPKKLLYTKKNCHSIMKPDITLEVDSLKKTKVQLLQYFEVFKTNIGNIDRNRPTLPGEHLKISVQIKNINDGIKLLLETDESYQLRVEKNITIEVVVIAKSYFGARHAFETLSQLIWYDLYDNSFKILHEVAITDAPSFPYRGIMIDTARNYFPIQQLEKVIEGMSISKLNVLHLHLTDSVSFPIELPSLPEISRLGSYDASMIYTAVEMKRLIEYANLLGVRIILEVDAPSHINPAWNAYNSSEKVVICNEDDILNGHLNPDNNLSLDYLESIYRDLLDLSQDDDVFHIGGDEVNLTCWKNTESGKNQSNMLEFWANYTNRMMLRLKSANNNNFPKNVIMWSSPLTDSFQTLTLLDFKVNVTIQFWFGNPHYIITEGFKVIYSTVGHWYLDCGFGPWRPSMDKGVCDPYTPWTEFYKYRPWLVYNSLSSTLGGEVCLWSEQVGEESLETRIWPRAAAFAERMWSDPIYFTKNVYNRLDAHRSRLMSRGIKVGALWPRWCSQNPGMC